MFFLGIDGGGTKTAFLLINENGDIIEAKTIATVSYKHVGMDNSIALLKETVHEILNDREAYICLALPNWGESKDGDGEFLSRIKEITELPVKIVNDSVVGGGGDPSDYLPGLISLPAPDRLHMEEMTRVRKLVPADGMKDFRMKDHVTGLV